MSLRAALVGLGRAGEHWREALASHPDVELAYAVDADDARLVDGPWRARFRSVEELLAAGAPDLAVIATPPASHRAVARPLLEAGTDLIVEKPLAASAAEAAALEAEALRRGRRLATAAKFRFVEPLLRARELVARGRIGTQVEVRVVFTDSLSVAADWRGREVAGGGVALDAGPHAIDVLETLAGRVEALRFEVVERAQGGTVEDELVASAELAGGARGRVELSWNGHRDEPLARCTGTAGELVVGWRELELATPEGRETLPVGYDRRAAFRGVLDAFLAGRGSGPAPDHGARAVRLLEAARDAFERAEAARG